MAERLRAVPDVLGRAGHEMSDHGQSLAALQRACRGQAEEAQPGWVGSSAGALTRLLDGWAATSIAHIDRFGEHAAEMSLAAAGFTDMEDRNAKAARQAGGESRSA
jgi:uncharacterized protein YukE